MEVGELYKRTTQAFLERTGCLEQVIASQDIYGSLGITIPGLPSWVSNFSRQEVQRFPSGCRLQWPLDLSSCVHFSSDGEALRVKGFLLATITDYARLTICPRDDWAVQDQKTLFTWLA